ncbi:MAG: hypothetical protein ABWX96_22355, partial [Propionibacteriaceae bacterium]
MTSRPAAPRRSLQYAWLITNPLAAISLICLVAFWIAEPDWWRESWFGGILAFLALAVANIGVFSVVIRRQSFYVVVTEIPLVLALFFLPPVTVILAATLATLAAQIYTRAVPTRLWFNVAKAAVATSAALLVIEAFPDIRGAGPGTWGILFAAVMASDIVSPVAFAGVMTLLQGRHAGQEALSAGLTMLLTAAINTAVGLLFLVALDATPWAAALLAVLVAALILAFRSFAEFFRQHRTLADVYDLTLAIRETGTDGGLPDALLGRVRALMRSEYATLWLPAQGRHPEVLLTARVDDAGLLDISPTPVAVRERTVANGHAVAVG